MRAPETAICPRCGSQAVPIVYGLPAGELFRAADRGEVVLGGCMVFDEQPEWACRGVDCGLEFAAPQSELTPDSLER